MHLHTATYTFMYIIYLVIYLYVFIFTFVFFVGDVSLYSYRPIMQRYLLCINNFWASRAPFPHEINL